MAITYTPANTVTGKPAVAVRLDGRVVGLIRKDDQGYVYKPTGGAAGAHFPTLAECKRSLEAA
jgi:hypothetical protein